MNCKQMIVAGALVAALLVPGVSRAGTLGTDVIALFPKDVGEFAYADLREARKQKWFPQLKQQLLPERFRQFEQFLATAGIDPNTQVEELAWALVPSGMHKSSQGSTLTVPTGEQIVGVALGQFNPASAARFFKTQKLPTKEVRGYTLFAFGSGAGPNDLFFFFLDSNTAAFGHRQLLEKLLDIRFGLDESLLNNDKFFPLVNESNGRGVIWAVLNPGYTRLALEQLVPSSTQFAEAAPLINKLQGMLISVSTSSGVDARFQALCASTEDANTFAALLQAGVLYRRYQASQSNPELASMLDSARIVPTGDRLEIRLGITDEQMMSLIRSNTFALHM